jgi:hypothetical protein
MTCLSFPFPWREGRLIDLRMIVGLRLAAKSFEQLVRLERKSRLTAHAKGFWTALFLCLAVVQDNAFVGSLMLILIVLNSINLVQATRRALLLQEAIGVGSWVASQ